MLRPLVFALPLVMLGCLSSSGSSPNSTPGEDAGGLDANVPVQTVDGSVLVDGSLPSFAAGLGGGIIEHSQHFTLITKTGNEPGGAGVKGSSSFKLISGVSAPAKP